MRKMRRGVLSATLFAMSIASCAIADDLNGDGVENVLDSFVAKFGSPRGETPTGGVAAGGETIVASPLALSVGPGETGFVLLRLTGNTTPLFGYSLAIRAIPGAGSTGSVSAVLLETSFLSSLNLIDAAPENPPVDPLFTVILPWNPDGVFLSTNTADGSTVLASDGVNDVLAKVAFKSTSDAAGTFQLQLGPATALADGNGFPVSFAFSGGQINVEGELEDPDLNNDGFVGAPDLALLLGDWGTCATLPPDLDLDGTVGASDLALLLGQWGATNTPADLNQNGLVDSADIAILLGDWGAITPPCADLNGDGEVGPTDLAVLLGAWS